MDYAHWLSAAGAAITPALAGLGFLLISYAHSRIIELATNLAPINMAVDAAVAAHTAAIARIQADVAALAATHAAGVDQDAEVSALAAKLQASVDALAASIAS